MHSQVDTRAASAGKKERKEVALVPGLSAPETVLGKPSKKNDCTSLVFLLYGPPDVCKTTYCQQFIEDGLSNNEQCIYASLAINERDFDAFLSDPERPSSGPLALIDLNRLLPKAFSRRDKGRKRSTDRTMATLLTEIEEVLETGNNRYRTLNKGGLQKGGKESGNNQPRHKNSLPPNHHPRIRRVVFDSLANLSLLIGETNLLHFIVSLITVIRKFHVTAILESSSASSMEIDLVNRLKSLVDGTIEIKVEESADSETVAVRKIRISSQRQMAHEAKWSIVKIDAGGRLSFESIKMSSLTCTLCGKAIARVPLTHSNLVFDSKSCLDTYLRLSEAYGQRISDTGLTSEILDMSFFFVDIVGLSDPSLSVTSQIQKINALNTLIANCPVMKKLSQERRIILPTGDGMVIGFYFNPTLPLDLSVQLHQSIQKYNAEKSIEEHLAVRIGLASGPVFTVPDINNIPNIWGPGVILARRVMDIGDNGHILVEGGLAEKLVVLSPEYASQIKLLNSDFQIKHGQRIRLYSAFSSYFGNPNQPMRLS